MSDLRLEVEALERELSACTLEAHRAIGHRLRALLAVPEPPREKLREKVDDIIYDISDDSGLYNSTLPKIKRDVFTDRILALLPEETGLSHPPAREETRLICDTPFDDEVWRCEACGDEWVFTDGTPEQNHMEYCHACGRKIVAIVRPEPEEDEEEEDTP